MQSIRSTFRQFTKSNIKFNSEICYNIDSKDNTFDENIGKFIKDVKIHSIERQICKNNGFIKDVDWYKKYVERRVIINSKNLKTGGEEMSADIGSSNYLFYRCRDDQDNAFNQYEISPGLMNHFTENLFYTGPLKKFYFSQKDLFYFNFFCFTEKGEKLNDKDEVNEINEVLNLLSQKLRCYLKYFMYNNFQPNDPSISDYTTFLDLNFRTQDLCALNTMIFFRLNFFMNLFVHAVLHIFSALLSLEGENQEIASRVAIEYNEGEQINLFEITSTLKKILDTIFTEENSIDYLQFVQEMNNLLLLFKYITLPEKMDTIDKRRRKFETNEFGSRFGFAAEKGYENTLKNWDTTLAHLITFSHYLIYLLHIFIKVQMATYLSFVSNMHYHFLSNYDEKENFDYKYGYDTLILRKVLNVPYDTFYYYNAKNEKKNQICLLGPRILEYLFQYLPKSLYKKKGTLPNMEELSSEFLSTFFTEKIDNKKEKFKIKNVFAGFCYSQMDDIIYHMLPFYAYSSSFYSFRMFEQYFNSFPLNEMINADNLYFINYARRYTENFLVSYNESLERAIESAEDKLQKETENLKKEYEAKFKEKELEFQAKNQELETKLIESKESAQTEIKRTKNQLTEIQRKHKEQEDRLRQALQKAEENNDQKFIKKLEEAQKNMEIRQNQELEDLKGKYDEVQSEHKKEQEFLADQADVLIRVQESDDLGEKLRIINELHSKYHERTDTINRLKDLVKGKTVENFKAQQQIEQQAEDLRKQEENIKNQEKALQQEKERIAQEAQEEANRRAASQKRKEEEVKAEEERIKREAQEEAERKQKELEQKNLKEAASRKRKQAEVQAEAEKQREAEKKAALNQTKDKVKLYVQNFNFGIFKEAGLDLKKKQLQRALRSEKTPQKIKDDITQGDICMLDSNNELQEIKRADFYEKYLTTQYVQKVQTLWNKERKSKNVVMLSKLSQALNALDQFKQDVQNASGIGRVYFRGRGHIPPSSGNDLGPFEYRQGSAKVTENRGPILIDKFTDENQLSEKVAFVGKAEDSQCGANFWNIVKKDIEGRSEVKQMSTLYNNYLKVIKGDELKAAMNKKASKNQVQWGPFTKVYMEKENKVPVDNNIIFNDIKSTVDTMFAANERSNMYNLILLSFGLSGSGKTYTLLGDEKASTRESGVYHKVLNYILSENSINSKIDSIKLKSVQAYNGYIYDVLKEKDKNDFYKIEEVFNDEDKLPSPQLFRQSDDGILYVRQLSRDDFEFQASQHINKPSTEVKDFKIKLNDDSSYEELVKRSIFEKLMNTTKSKYKTYNQYPHVFSSLTNLVAKSKEISAGQDPNTTPNDNIYLPLNGGAKFYWEKKKNKPVINVPYNRKFLGDDQFVGLRDKKGINEITRIMQEKTETCTLMESGQTISGQDLVTKFKNIYQQIKQNRPTRSTPLNKNSSRSHLFIIVQLYIKDGSGGVYKDPILVTACDLAGLETTSKYPGQTGEGAKGEGTYVRETLAFRSNFADYLRNYALGNPITPKEPPSKIQGGPTSYGGAKIQRYAYYPVNISRSVIQRDSNSFSFAIYNMLQYLVGDSGEDESGNYTKILTFVHAPTRLFQIDSTSSVNIPTSLQENLQKANNERCKATLDTLEYADILAGNVLDTAAAGVMEFGFGENYSVSSYNSYGSYSSYGSSRSKRSQRSSNSGYTDGKSAYTDGNSAYTDGNSAYTDGNSAKHKRKRRVPSGMYRKRALLNIP